jgi:DNA-binding XRE family transcriptional regulator
MSLFVFGVKPVHGQVVDLADQRRDGRELRHVLATNMRKLRVARELSPEALAHESGINRTNLSSAERAEPNVSIDNIARIANTLRHSALHAERR